MTDYGITGYGAYVPRLRLERSAIAEAHQWMAPTLKSLSRGTRAFASWDEDTITMSVEAVRDCIGKSDRSKTAAITLASTTLPYADLQNSAIIAGAVQLPREVSCQDMAGSQRAGLTALATLLRSKGPEQILVAADKPRAKPASATEMTYGAGAAAFRLGSDGVLARHVGSAQISTLFIDHFRASEQAYDYFWEERWIRDEGYAKLIPEVVKAALADADLKLGDIDSLVFASTLRGAAAMLAKRIGFSGQLIDDMQDTCGMAGAAHPLLMLTAALEGARPGQHILLLSFGQGAEACILKVTDAIASFRPVRGLSAAVADGLTTSSYLRMLSFYGEMELEWGMRAEKTGKAALTTLYRESGQLAGFCAGKCAACGTVQFPQLAYCVNPSCLAAAEQFKPLSLTDEPAKVLTYTADWLSYHPAPPLYVGFVQFDIGARLLMEMVDVGRAGLDQGTPLRIVHRIKEVDNVRGFNRYFWKATPVAA